MKGLVGRPHPPGAVSWVLVQRVVTYQGHFLDMQGHVMNVQRSHYTKVRGHEIKGHMI